LPRVCSLLCFVGRTDRAEECALTYVVTDNCIKCKYMHCVEVCPAHITAKPTLLSLRKGCPENWWSSTSDRSPGEEFEKIRSQPPTVARNANDVCSILHRPLLGLSSQ
jgi:hypothetical protein